MSTEWVCVWAWACSPACHVAAHTDPVLFPKVCSSAHSTARVITFSTGEIPFTQASQILPLQPLPEGKGNKTYSLLNATCLSKFIHAYIHIILWPCYVESESHGWIFGEVSGFSLVRNAGFLQSCTVFLWTQAHLDPRPHLNSQSTTGTRNQEPKFWSPKKAKGE